MTGFWLNMAAILAISGSRNNANGGVRFDVRTACDGQTAVVLRMMLSSCLKMEFQMVCNVCARRQASCSLASCVVVGASRWGSSDD